MANNIPQLKADIRTAFVANLDTDIRTKLVDRFISGYQEEWNARVLSGTADTPVNRGIFASDKIFDYIQNVYRSGSSRELAATLPQPETIT
jgi:hypothetical protein